MNLVNNITESLKQSVADAAAAAKAAGKINFEELPQFVLEVPKDKAHGDFASNIALVLAKQAKMRPRDIATAIAEEISDSTLVAKVEIAGAGFLNFFLNNSWLYDVLPLVQKQDEKYGTSDFGHGEKVQVEFVSANPTGLLHMGNARGGALGSALANVLNAAGYECEKEYYINDAGNQIVKLGLSLEARYRQVLGDEDYPFPDDGYHGVDIIDTAKHIVEMHGDSYLKLPAEERQAKMVEIALKEKLNGIKSGLDAFGVNYDVWFSESTLHESGAVMAVVDELRQKGLIYEKEGALWLETTKFGDEKDEVLVRSNGIPTYFAADIAYHKNKFDRGFKKIINIWGADHHGHVARLKGAMTALGYNGDDVIVILMQLVRLFQNGEIVKMSKRTGQFVTLQELIEDVGKDAARYFFIMRNPDSQMDFDLDLAKSQSNENPVYYVQYAHARICSILSVAGMAVPNAEKVDLSLLKTASELALIRKIADWPDEVSSAAKDLAPYRLPRYANDLATLFHSFYNECRVLSDDEELKKARLVLVDATRITLRNALTLLGVSAPERM